ncbi:hypothetical protein BOX15_Mlig022535g1 [Macrostomum lignano]|uniref:UPF0573 protein C2orf70 homolog n=2 Tax=Macrostomum lignano TaxID=282301 RepID=A0A1I8GL57_9PLAT|nr:hypothetical protein BOX15_Mlig022535g1 [Macrostomum lignano]
MSSSQQSDREILASSPDCPTFNDYRWYPDRPPLPRPKGPPLVLDYSRTECPPPYVARNWRGYTGAIGYFPEQPAPTNRRYFAHGLEPPEAGRRDCALRYQEIRAYRGSTAPPPGVPFNDAQLAALWGPQLMSHPASVSHHPQSISRLPSAFQYN